MRKLAVEQLYPETRRQKVVLISFVEEPEIYNLYSQIEVGWSWLYPDRRPALPSTITFEDARQDKNLSTLELADIYLRTLWFLSDNDLDERVEKARNTVLAERAEEGRKKKIRESNINSLDEWLANIDQGMMFVCDYYLSISENRSKAVAHYLATNNLETPYTPDISLKEFWELLHKQTYLDAKGHNIFSPISDGEIYRFFRAHPNIVPKKGRK
jgi:hypothetical protein